MSQDTVTDVWLTEERLGRPSVATGRSCSGGSTAGAGTPAARAAARTCAKITCGSPPVAACTALMPPL